MLNLDNLSQTQIECLAEDCEDFLLHRHIPLRSHALDDIIDQAFKEGYQLHKFDRHQNEPIQRTIS